MQLCFLVDFVSLSFYLFLLIPDTTYPRLIGELSSHALPIMWDDVSNFTQLEAISLMCYNRV